MRSLRIEFKRRPRQLAALASAAIIGLIATTTLIVFISKTSRDEPGADFDRKDGVAASGASASSDESLKKNLRKTSPPSTTAPTLAATIHDTTILPSTFPSPFPLLSPSTVPSSEPPFMLPSTAPTHTPTMQLPSVNPTLLLQPSLPPSQVAQTTLSPTQTSTLRPTTLTYVPGDLTVNQQGLRLSTGLQVKLIATTGQPVRYANNTYSTQLFHALPDFGATFPRQQKNTNAGGWIYVSNSETEERGSGGVGALTFNKNGGVIDYQMVLEGSTKNCGGGPTPWLTWISCEETTGGQNWQVDPTGQRPAEVIELGKSSGGQFESFAYDIFKGHYFVTEDYEFGPLRRWIPAQYNETDPWSTLHGPGETTYLRLLPTSSSGGTYEWTTDQQAAANNANAFYRNSEGIDVYDHELYFVSKELKTLFILNLDGNNYTSHTTRQGLFDGQPDQLARVIGDENDSTSSGKGQMEPLLYFTEDGGQFAGVHARNRQGQYLTILESHVYTNDETTGLAFSPDFRFLYVAYQKVGKLFAVSRQDGLPFDAKSLNVKYHATTTTTTTLNGN